MEATWSWSRVWVPLTPPRDQKPEGQVCAQRVSLGVVQGTRAPGSLAGFVTPSISLSSQLQREWGAECEKRL